MKTTRLRQLVALRLGAPDNAPVAFFEDQEGGSRALTGEQAVHDEFELPRWLVRQIGYVEGASAVLGKCCPNCESTLRGGLERTVMAWRVLDG